MRYSLAILGLLLVAALCDAAVVQRRYRNTEEVLVPVTVIQDGEEIKEIIPAAMQSEVTKVGAAAVAEDIARAVDEVQKLEAVASVVEAQRPIDEAILEEEIKEVVAEENEQLLKALQVKEEKLEEAKEVKKEEEPHQDLKKLPVEEAVVQPEAIPEAQQSLKEEKPVQQIKSVLDRDSSEEVVSPVKSSDNEAGETDGTLRQATQATPSQTTTQQNFVQQFIQNSPLGQFFTQITGQNNQGQVANDDAATPAPTVPAFLAPAITTVQNAAQSVVNSTTSAFQGLTNLASSLTTQFQSTLSGLGGQQPDQQSAGDATTVRPQGPFQQLVSTIMGNNNQQSSPTAQPSPQQQGPLQGLLNIFQGNNNRPQANTPSDATISSQPGKEPEVVEPSNDVIEEAALNTPDNLSNEIRNSAEVDDSFEDVVQPEEMIVVQDDATQTQEQEQDQGYVPK